MNAEQNISTPPVGRMVAAIALESIIRDHMPASVRQSLDPARVLEQFEATRLDSLDRLSFAGKVNAFFGVHETGLEDNLLRSGRAADWVDIAWRSLGRAGPYISFETSGTTGDPKRVTQYLSDLLQETEELSRIFGSVGRIISTVSAKHIYGFLFTALLPERLGVPRIDARDAGASFWRSEPAEHDLIVSFPEYIQFLSDSRVALPGGSWIVTSTAPCPPVLWDRVRAAGAESMSEVYGSTETGGIGVRHSKEDPFELFSYFSRSDDPVTLLRERPGGSSTCVSLMDEIEWVDQRRLRPLRRRDGAVQIGGVNVSTETVARKIQEHADVLGARVWVDSKTGRLGARVRVTASGDEAAVRGWIEDRLLTNELPKALEIFRE
ncbi:MAG: AMP-binding protein [Spirochaetales bacterium]